MSKISKHTVGLLKYRIAELEFHLDYVCCEGCKQCTKDQDKLEAYRKDLETIEKINDEDN